MFKKNNVCVCVCLCIYKYIHTNTPKLRRFDIFSAFQVFARCAWWCKNSKYIYILLQCVGAVIVCVLTEHPVTPSFQVFLSTHHPRDWIWGRLKLWRTFERQEDGATRPQLLSLLQLRPPSSSDDCIQFEQQLCHLDPRCGRRHVTHFCFEFPFFAQTSLWSPSLWAKTSATARVFLSATVSNLTTTKKKGE